MDLGELIGLVAVLTGAGILGVSYFGAYLLGVSRGRREAELQQPAQLDRMAYVEGLVETMARSVERLTEAQRNFLLEQSRLNSLQDAKRISRVNTPS